MTTANDVLNVARKEIGTEESPANSNRTKYGAWYGMDAQPWCGQFVSWCFAQAGLPLHITTDKGYAYCPYGVNYFKKAGRWSSTPSVGAIVFYGSPSESVHTGIVESFDNSTITAIEGNTALGNDANGGAVMRRQRARNNWVVGYGVPVYSSQPEPKVKPMYDPALTLEPVVASLNKNGGTYLVAASGAVYAFGVPYKGGANGQAYFKGRQAARIEEPNDAERAAGRTYTIIDTADERYAF